MVNDFDALLIEGSERFSDGFATNLGGYHICSQLFQYTGKAGNGRELNDAMRLIQDPQWSKTL